jgi:hypothetical protein
MSLGERMRRWRWILLAVAIAVPGCGGSNPTEPEPLSDEIEPNDFVAQGLDTLSTTDLVYHGATSGGSDVDLFMVHALAPVNLHASLDWSTGSDLELTLSNTDGLFVRHVDTNGHPESCTLSGLPAGNYTVRVGSLTDATTHYTLTIGQR